MAATLSTGFRGSFGFDLIDAIKDRLAAGRGRRPQRRVLRRHPLLLGARVGNYPQRREGRYRYAVRRGRGDGVALSADAASSFADLEESFAARGLGSARARSF